MSEWASGDLITVALMNQKTVYVGSAAPGTTYAGQLWLDSDDNILYQRDKDDAAWIVRLGKTTGAYTGDGNATQAITGVKKTPSVLMIYDGTDGGWNGLIMKADNFGTKTALNRLVGGGLQWEDDHIISLDTDGFTVGDGTGGTDGNVCNINARSYNYIALG